MTSNRSVRSRTSDWSVAGTSRISAVCAMSPKSMMPVTRSSSSRSRLSRVTSLWMSCERSVGSAGTTRRWNRSRTRPRSSRRSGASVSDTRRARSGRCRWSHQIVRPADGWKNPRSARPMRPTTSPMCVRASGSSSVGAAERPGRSGSRRTRCAAPSTTAVVTVDPSSAGRATGTGRPGSTDAIQLDRGHLHLDDSLVLGGVRDLQDPRRAGRIGQAEVLVAFADERLGDGVEAVGRARDLLSVASAEGRRRGIEDIGRGHRRRS